MRVFVIVSLGAGVLAESILHFDNADSTIGARGLPGASARELKDIEINQLQMHENRIVAHALQGREMVPPLSIQARQSLIEAADGITSARLTRRMISRQPSGNTPSKFHQSYSESNIQQPSRSKGESLGSKSKSQNYLSTMRGSSSDTSPWRLGQDPFRPGSRRSSLDTRPPSRSPSPPKIQSQGSFRDESPWRHGGGAVHDSAPIRHSILGFNPADPYPPPPRVSSQGSMLPQDPLSRASSLLRTGSPPKTGGLSRGGSFAKEGKLSRTVSWAKDIATPFGSSTSETSRGPSRTSSLAKSDASLLEPITPVTGFRASQRGPQTPTTPATPSTPFREWKYSPPGPGHE